MCQELFMETIWWRESKDTQIPGLIAHDDTEKLGNLLWLADTLLGSRCQKCTVLYKREWGGVVIPAALEEAQQPAPGKTTHDGLNRMGTMAQA